jgi:hypothetical protein
MCLQKRLSVFAEMSADIEEYRGGMLDQIENRNLSARFHVAPAAEALCFQ